MDAKSTTITATVAAATAAYDTLTYRGRHRGPNVRVVPELVTFTTTQATKAHLEDGRSVDDANALAMIDALDAALTLRARGVS